MALAYTLKKYKDVYTIENTGVVNLTYTLSRGGCGLTTQVSTGNILPSGTVTLPINYIDGIYQVTVSDSVSTEKLPDILFYNNFLLYIISKINTLYCKCTECSTCQDCNDVSCNTYLNLLSSTNAYLLLDIVPYQVYLKLISKTLQCDISNVVCDFTNETQISGDEEVIDVMNHTIASYYTAFYLKEFVEAIDIEEETYIKEKFKYNNISKCFKKIGIDIQEIIDSYIDMNVHYWQQPDTSTNITDILNSLTQSYIDSKPFVNIVEFQEGKKISYFATGRVAFILQEIADANFVIEDSLGNDITDEYQYQYVPNLSAGLFVSINPAVPSTLYFKFKHNL